MIRSFSVLPTILVLMVSLTACGPTVAGQAGSEVSAAPASGPPREVQTRTQEFLSAWAGTESAAVAAFFTEDATAVIDGNRFTGRAAIERGWLASNVPVISNVRITTTERVDRRGEQVAVRGRYAFTARPPQQAEQQGAGTHELVWTLVGGSWLIESMTVQND